MTSRSFGPGHGDVEQPVVLLEAARLHGLARCRHETAIVGFAGRPDRHRRAVRQRRHDERLVAAEHLAAVDEDHDRRFQPLGSVHGHDPHLVARRIEIALDLVRGGPEALEKGGERRRLGQLGVVGEAQEGVDGVARFAAEPGDELRAAVATGRAGSRRIRTGRAGGRDRATSPGPRRRAAPRRRLPRHDRRGQRPRTRRRRGRRRCG